MNPNMGCHRLTRWNLLQFGMLFLWLPKSPVAMIPSLIPSTHFQTEHYDFSSCISLSVVDKAVALLKPSCPHPRSASPYLDKCFATDKTFPPTWLPTRVLARLAKVTLTWLEYRHCEDCRQPAWVPWSQGGWP